MEPPMMGLLKPSNDFNDSNDSNDQTDQGALEASTAPKKI
jgi:hypothetical protein